MFPTMHHRESVKESAIVDSLSLIFFTFIIFDLLLCKHVQNKTSTSTTSKILGGDSEGLPPEASAVLRRPRRNTATAGCGRGKQRVANYPEICRLEIGCRVP